LRQSSRGPQFLKSQALPGSPITCGRTKIAGIKIQDTAHDTLDGGAAARRSQLHGRRTAQIHEAILTAFGLSAEVYSLTQLRYDLRKMKAHGLPERLGRQYCYRLTEKGLGWPPCSFCSTNAPAALWPTPCFTIGPEESSKPRSRVETAYCKADAAIQKLVDLLATWRKSEKQILRVAELESKA
jgi:hypothetical protein